MLKPIKSIFLNKQNLFSLWIILIFFELFSHILNPAGLFFSGNILIKDKILLFFTSSILLGLILLFAILWQSVLLRISTSLFAKIFSRIPLVLFLFFYFLSWFWFLVDRQFIGIDSFNFFIHNPLQIIQHLYHLMSRSALVSLFISSLLICISFLLSNIISKHLLRVKNHSWKPLGFTLLFNLFLVSLAIKFISSDQKLYYQFSFSTNPTSTLITDFIFRYSEGFPIRTNSSRLLVESRPLVNLESYSQGIDLSKQKKLNVLIVLIESLRTDQLMAFGGNREVMPHVDRLADRSVRYSNAYTQSSHSSYADLCTMSSHYPLRSITTHFYPENPPYPRVLIYDILKHLGYRTAILSSQNEHWGDMYNYLNTGSIDYFFHSQSYKGKTYIPGRADRGFTRWAKQAGRSGKIDDKITINEAINWIGDKDKKPFFMYLNLQNSHAPFVVPDDFPRKFDLKKIEFEHRVRYFPKDKILDVKNRYADSLHYVDHQLGRLFEHLKSSKLFDNTIIVITGDTGQAFYEHDFAGHASFLYDEVTRVPLFFYIPGDEPRTTFAPAQHIDIPPTLLTLLGLPSHPSFQGYDLSKLEIGSHRSRFLVAQTPFAYQYGVVKEGFKLLWDPKAYTKQLFDLLNDPGETKNLIGVESQVEKELWEILSVWIAFQIQYYNSPNLYNRVYPPFFFDTHEKLRNN